MEAMAMLPRWIHRLHLWGHAIILLAVCCCAIHDSRDDFLTARVDMDSTATLESFCNVGSVLGSLLVELVYPHFGDLLIVHDLVH